MQAMGLVATSVPYWTVLEGSNTLWNSVGLTLKSLMSLNTTIMKKLRMATLIGSYLINLLHLVLHTEKN